MALLIQNPAQLPGGIGDGIAVVGNGGLGLVGVGLPFQIPGLRAPDVGPVLRGPAVGGVVDRVLHQGSVVVDAKPRGVFHRPVTGLRGARSAAAVAVVDLAVHAAAHVEAILPQVLAVSLDKGPGADGLGLQSLQGPVPRHLIGNHAFYIVLQVHYIDDPQASRTLWNILKASGIPAALEPGNRSKGADAQRMVSIKVLIEDLRGAGPGHGNGGASGGAHGDSGYIRLSQGHEPPVPVIIAELITRPLCVLQVCGGQGRAAVAQPHLYHAVGHGESGRRAEEKKCHNEKEGQQLIFHGTSQCSPA